MDPDFEPGTDAHALLTRHLGELLGTHDAQVLDPLLARLHWVQVRAGDTLIAQGEPGDAMYLALGGRLRAYIDAPDGSRRLVREVLRGEIVGELSLYTDEPRAASVVAARDALLVRLARDDFLALMTRSPHAAMALTRRALRLMQSRAAPLAPGRPTTIALLPASDGIDAAAFATQLRAALGTDTRVAVVERDTFAPAAGGTSALDARRFALALDALESTHELVLLVGDAEPGAWTARCIGHADELLLLADATRAPHLHPTETALLGARPPNREQPQRLLLIHPPGTHAPRGTRHWLERRPVSGHLHLRAGLARDMARLARVLTHRAVGLVLAGGGARGLAHLGVYRALCERGIEIDWVGGTSIGAVMAAYVASDQPPDAVLANARRAFSLNPTGDFNMLPLLSLIKGRRVRAVIRRAVDELFGGDADVEDLWKGFFAITTNYTRASEQRVQHGNLVKSLMSSISIPGALPPVLHDGDLLCDGGSFNNFPVDVMRAMPGVGRVIGVDLEPAKPQPIELEELPSSWALLRDRFRAPAKRRYRLPSLAAYLMRVPTLYSRSRRAGSQALTDLCFHPPLDGVGLLEWARFEEIVMTGYRHAVDRLTAPGLGPTWPVPAPGPAAPQGAALAPRALASSWDARTAASAGVQGHRRAPGR